MQKNHEFLLNKNLQKDVIDIVRMFITGGVFVICALLLLGYQV